MKHLFLLVPNNSGSSLVHKLIAQSPNVAVLPQEGQHVAGFAGPVPRDLGVVHVFSTNPAFADTSQYDWPAICRTFGDLWDANNATAPVRMEKSPPNVVRAAMLDEHFPNAHFVVSWRNPYAMAEGALRNSPHAEPRSAATHALNMLQAAKTNLGRFDGRSVVASYEDITADPQGFLDRVTVLLPELGPLVVDPDVPIDVKGTHYAGIVDTNDEQIANLSPGVIRQLNNVFGKHADVLEWFGYEVLEPSAGQAVGDRPARLESRRRARGARGGGQIAKRMRKGDFDLRQVGTYDVSGLATIVTELETEWPTMTYRQDQLAAHTDTMTIPVLWNEPPLFKKIRPRDEIERHHGETFVPVIADLEEIATAYYGPGWFLRMILTRLPVGGHIPLHSDSGRSFRVSHRVHLPVITNDATTFRVGGTTMPMPAGELWEINNFRPHEVINEGTEARVHLIFDWHNPDDELSTSTPWNAGRASATP